MKRLCFIFFLFASLCRAQPLYYNAENLRSDTFDVLKTIINLEIGTTTNSIIKGNAQIRFAPKINGRNFIRFDLLKLVIDSIRENYSPRTYSYNDTILKINFASAKNITDTSLVTIYYHGPPQIDATGWGGFYFDNTQNAQYAYNLGVGFGAIPHNYGRVWFPCFDNFVERCLFEFNITTDTSRRAYCNGQLISDVIQNLKRTRHWVLNNEIPSYLASVAAGNYTQVNWNVITLTGNKPITLAVYATDSNALKQGFVNLKNCITGFENYFGPYRWNRFGYSVVPFNNGAMEHATNIAYPKPFLGSLNYEADLMAHELSHHWFGDLITCETPQDMWINEGMATFCSYMFLEWQYGKSRYMNSIQPVHDDLLHFLHLREGGFRAVSGVPLALTYGDHVYKKGADMAHTLRGYMGDSLFFLSLKYALQQNAFKSVNSIQLRNLMQTASGMNLTDFFNDCILTGGWAHFSLDSYSVQPAGNSFNVSFTINQKLFGKTAYHHNVPLEVSFFKSDWSRAVSRFSVSGASGNFTMNVPFNPVYVALNYDHKISDATSSEAKTIKASGSYAYSIAKAVLTVSGSGADSSLVRVIHNYVKPDGFKNNPKNFILSNQHYWKVEGILSPGFASKIRFNYDGNKSTTGTYSYLDTLLLRSNGDSLSLFYRANPADDWHLIHDALKTKTGTRTGNIEADSLKPGEYAFGNALDTTILSLRSTSGQSSKVKIYPNPVNQKLTVEIANSKDLDCTMSFLSVDGKIIRSHKITSLKSEIDISGLAKGTWMVELTKDDRILYSQKIVTE